MTPIQRLICRSTQSLAFNQGQFPPVGLHYSRTTAFTPNNLSQQGRFFHLTRLVRENEQSKPKVQVDASKMSVSQMNPSLRQAKSSSLLNFIKKSLPTTVKLQVPNLNFSTGSAKEVSKNLGNKNRSRSKISQVLNLRELLTTPSPFMIYGLSGIIPFSSIPIYMQMTSSYCPTLAHVQLVYGACILSFLGGISWGIHLLQPAHSTLKSLGYSISLPLIAWPAVLIYPNVMAFPLMIMGVAFAGYIDVFHQPYPIWFKLLRFVLSSLVVLSLSFTFAFSFTKTQTSIDLTKVEASTEKFENKDNVKT